ncbi:hypothetical protein GCM10027271_42640 [Saccharopolyspora gloriosae]|uniref:Uncharacterized protein n=1 Tax=Saccharopolyspora gloriosae TaxID=455344 RepID=A0A840NEU0_9PSEU|nr:hypothetical protein [Saccharopolyspora gloriosae]MBB5070440.1 hypothetical protein [Saccharopolyspora gloriosae]
MHALRHTLTRSTETLQYWVLTLVLSTTTALDHLATRAHRIRFDDTGSETTEKAVLTAIGLAVAVGLGAAITAVVNKYQGQIH